MDIEKIKVGDVIHDIRDAGALREIEGKGLSTNDYTNEDKSKLEGIEANAQKNKIESIKVNGSDVTPDPNKAVNVSVPTKMSDLNLDGGDMASGASLRFKNASSSMVIQPFGIVKESNNQSHLISFPDRGGTVALTSDIPDVSGKQDTIQDLETIRSGAAKGETSVQPLDIEDMVKAEPIGSIIPPVNPSEFATKEEVDQLDQEVAEMNGGDIPLNPTMTSGYIYNGSVRPSSTFKYSEPIKLNYGDKIKIASSGYNFDVLSKTNAGGTSYSALITGDSTATTVKNYEYTATSEIYVAVCCNTATDWSIVKNVEGTVAKKTELSAVEIAVKRLSGGEQNLFPEMVFGYIYNGSSHGSTTYKYSVPFLVKAGDTLVVSTAGYSFSVISRYSGGSYTQLVQGDSTVSDLKEYTYTPSEDMNLVVCCKIDPAYLIKVVYDRTTVTPEELSKEAERIDSLEDKVQEYESYKIEDYGYQLKKVLDAYGYLVPSDYTAVSSFKDNTMSATRITLIYDGEVAENTTYQYRLYIYNANKSFIERSGIEINFGDFAMVARCSYYRFLIYKFVSGNLAEITAEDISKMRVFGYTANTRLPYDGERISIRPMLKWRMIARATYGNYLQDGDQYNNILFQFYDQRTQASELKGLEVIDLVSGSVLQQIDLGFSSEHHNNAVCFSDQKWDDEDEFPLLYASGLFNRATFVYRITGTIGNYSLTKVQTITVDDLDKNFTSFVDKQRNLFVILSSSAGMIGTYRSFNLPNPQDGDIDLSVENAIDQFDVSIQNPYGVDLANDGHQGGCIHNGVLYQCFGFDDRTGWMSAINLLSHKIDSTLNFTDIGLNYEPEGTFIHGSFLGAMFNGGSGRFIVDIDFN